MFTSSGLLRVVFPRRSDEVHKGHFGRLLVVAGSEVYTGSACFVSMAAYRAGCDMVYVAAPERAADVAAGFSPMVMTKALEGGFLSRGHVAEVLEFSRRVRATAVVVGPGLGRGKKTRRAVVELVAGLDLPTVVDADAVRALSGKPSAVEGKEVVLTPHADEFRELTGKALGSDVKERVPAVAEAALSWGQVFLVKGNIDVIASPSRVVANRTGTPFMTKGGFGDTLAGLLGAFVARNVNVFTAAYVNGKAGELAAAEFKEGVTPLDLIGRIPSVK